MTKHGETTSVVAVPEILGAVKTAGFPLDAYEIRILQTAKKLLDDGYYPQCLLEVWKAGIHNIRRRIELYGVELFLSVVKDEGGRKNYNEKGETMGTRWENVEDSVLIQGARKLGLLKPKAAKVMETMNWMRNHASPSHETDDEVEMADVIPLASLLQTNLFDLPLPAPGHSVAGLFKPVKEVVLTQGQCEVFADNIRGFRAEDVRTCFGFLLDLLCNGEEPSLSNAQTLLPIAWEKITDDLKRTAGFRYHTFDTDSSSDKSHDKGAQNRLLEFLVSMNGIVFIPDGSRAVIYRKIARGLAKAKDAAYGWSKEESIAASIEQLGSHVPSICFEEFYQEVIAVCCGNYWGRSQAYEILEDYILNLNTHQLREILRMFRENTRVRDELSAQRPKYNATELIKRIEAKFILQSDKDDAADTIENIDKL